MKKLCRFYCVDCDNAWIELIEEKQNNTKYHGKCDYCLKEQEAEEVE